MGGRLFGTDGVRGLANADLTPELALRLATAAAQVLGERRGLASLRRRCRSAGRRPGGRRRGDVARAVATAARQASPSRPLAVLGRDPRASGEMLEAAVAAGLASAGVDVVLLGVLPTPAVAFLTADMGADLGVVISASHNAMPDNGIKIFAAGGLKLDDAVEDAIEARMDALGPLPTGEGVGRITPRRRCRSSLSGSPADRHPQPARRTAGGRRLRPRCRVRPRARGVPAGRRRGGRHRRQPGRV